MSLLALVWNGLGIMAFLKQVNMNEQSLNTIPEAQRILYTNVPLGVTVAFAIAYSGGALGCFALLMRKKWAQPIFVISLLAILVQMTYQLFISKALEVYGPTGVIMPIVLILIGIGLVWFSKKAMSKGWLK